jgi:hypothetical protein
VTKSERVDAARALERVQVELGQVCVCVCVCVQVELGQAHSEQYYKENVLLFKKKYRVKRLCITNVKGAFF